MQTTSKTIRVCGRRSCLGGAPLLAGRNRERDDRDDNDAVATDLDVTRVIRDVM